MQETTGLWAIACFCEQPPLSNCGVLAEEMRVSATSQRKLKHPTQSLKLSFHPSRSCHKLSQPFWGAALCWAPAYTGSPVLCTLQGLQGSEFCVVVITWYPYRFTVSVFLKLQLFLLSRRLWKIQYNNLRLNSDAFRWCIYECQRRSVPFKTQVLFFARLWEDDRT